jgi:hypothetical protein
MPYEFLSPATLHRAARFWRRLMHVEIRASSILKDPRESNGCRSCRSCAAQQTITILCHIAMLQRVLSVTMFYFIIFPSDSDKCLFPCFRVPSDPMITRQLRLCHILTTNKSFFGNCLMQFGCFFYIIIILLIIRVIKVKFKIYEWQCVTVSGVFK